MENQPKSRTHKSSHFSMANICFISGKYLNKQSLLLIFLKFYGII